MTPADEIGEVLRALASDMTVAQHALGSPTLNASPETLGILIHGWVARIDLARRIAEQDRAASILAGGAS